MGDAYPELAKGQAHVEKVLAKEETRFAETLDQGMEILEAAIDDLDGKQLPGDVIFKLYDTYGFPVDLTADVARERELTIDQAGFEAAMQGQKDKAKAASKFSAVSGDAIKTDANTEFLGYEATESACEVVALFKDGQAIDELADGDEGAVVLASTPFYAESGGQIGDKGILVNDGCSA
jgi:alanyl-tRNA synthetase